MSTKVRQPGGQTWRVRRRWLVRAPTVRVGALDWRHAEGRVANAEYHYSGVGQLKILLFAPVFALYLVRLAAALVSSLIAHARGVPWVVEAERDSLKARTLRWEAVGWSESRRLEREVVEAFRQGRERGGAAEAAPPTSAT